MCHSRIKAIFQGGEKNEIVDVFFHGYANYEKGIGQDLYPLNKSGKVGQIANLPYVGPRILR